MKKPVLAFVPLLLSLGLSAQTLDYGTNAPRSGDMLTRQMLEPFPEGDDGRDVVWDFSFLSENCDDADWADAVEVECFIDPDSSRLSMADGDVILRYSASEDTLFVVGRDTPLERLCYDVPQVSMTYPFGYGSVVSSNYEGHGTYCSRMNVRVAGTLRIESDAEGIVITGECDTLYNVLRVHTLRTGSSCMYSVTDMEFSDSSHIKQEIEERFEWYVRGYRYPLYETTTVTYYDDMVPVAGAHSASRITPEFMRLPDDPENDSILAADAAARAAMNAGSGLSSLAQGNGTAAADADIIHYSTSMSGSTLMLEYDLDADATLTCLVCNKMGMLFVSRRERVAAGTDCRMAFDCSGLTPNDYILYINVNGTVYSETFKVE